DRPSGALVVECLAEFWEAGHFADHEPAKLQDAWLNHQRELPAGKVTKVGLDVATVLDAEHLARDLVAGLGYRHNHDLGEEALFVSEVLIDGLFGDGGQRGDLVHARAEVAAAEKHHAGRRENCVALAHRSALLAGLSQRTRS